MMHAPHRHRRAARSAPKKIALSSPHRGDSTYETDDIYRLIVESADEFAIFTVDLEGNIRTWNTGAEHLFGYVAEEIIRRGISVVFVAEDRAQGIPHQEIEAALAKGKAADKRWHLRKDGSRFWADGYLMPLQDSLETVFGFLKIISDKTQEHRLLERALTAEIEVKRLRGEEPGAVTDTLKKNG